MSGRGGSRNKIMENKITIEFAHICENVIVAKNGNLSIINIFNQINANNFPAVHPQMFVVIGVYGKTGEYPVNIKIIKKGEEIPFLDFKPEINMRVPEFPAQGRFFAKLSPIIFKSVGFYEVDIYIEDQNKKLYFSVNKAS